MLYINIKTSQHSTETIDQFETRKEAREMLREYRIAYKETGLNLYLSTRSTKQWREESK